MKLHESLPAPPHFKIVVLEELWTEPGGFLRRVSRQLCTESPSGQRSSPFIYDEVDRHALDAVVVVPHFVATDPSGRRQRFVVLRSAIRPPLALRDGQRSPLPEPLNPGLWEVPAGLVEPDERGEQGLLRAVVRELWEETGFSVEAEQVEPLGPATVPAPGVVAERQYFFHVEVKPEHHQTPPLDGSALEAAGELIYVTLAGCLKAAAAGGLSDAKTELSLRRLADQLSSQGGVL